MKMLRVGIEGGAGFTGGELIRLLLAHPKVEIAAATSATFPGQPVFLAHPNLRGRTSLSFTRKLDYAKLDCLFLAGGHGDAMNNVPAILAETGTRLRIIDLSGDFRLRDEALYPVWYTRKHKAPALLKKFAYGLVELNRAEIGKARLIANPGCFATATALALGPLAQGGVSGVVSVTAITGSSGSGAAPTSITHHPTRHANLKAYKPFTHQHIPEIEQILERLAGKKALRLSLVPISGPFSRGIYAVCQVDLPKGWTAERVKDLYAAAYKGSSFVRLVPEPPSLNAVNGSNHCDVFVTVQDGRICVISAIDNLVKGASGQAIQNLNVMMGWDEDIGLEAAGTYP
ncbi:MAG: N-acetyl-gamma-glutamyl-phosphate reductase [Elusimicrobia bacterium RIFOXYD12_FULL_66_9]|nr:MAG: N-acetyl-gamma-glutamyl-phosphate reductase [Elusimicrobia bacterium RIFOXYD12_FULL_66_9]